MSSRLYNVRLREVDDARIKDILTSLELDDAPDIVAIRLALKHYSATLEAHERAREREAVAA